MIDRRGVLRALLLLLFAACLGLAACEEDDDPAKPAPCTDRNEPVISVEGLDDHKHKLQGALCEEDRGNGVLVPLTAPDHTHEYLLLEHQVEDILDGQWFRTESSRSLDHRHSVTYNPR